MAENADRNSGSGGRIVNGYEILDEIARGGMSRVYRGRRVADGQLVAVKMIHIDEVAADYERRLRREPEIQQGVGHENIVQLIDWFRLQDEFFLIMEYVDGRSLASVVRGETGALDFERMRSYFRQILPALGHLHDLGIIHRDIKPSNILIGRGGSAKLADFGIAKYAWQQGGTRTQQGLGTPEYMSPEQVQGSDIDHRTDIYSLGVSLFEILTARMPFSRGSDTPAGYAEVIRSVLEEPIPDPRTYNPELPPEIAKVIAKATAKNPADRYQSSKEFLDALEEVPVEDASPATVVLGAAAVAAATDREPRASSGGFIAPVPAYAAVGRDRDGGKENRLAAIWRRTPAIALAALLLVVAAAYGAFRMLGDSTELEAVAPDGQVDTEDGVAAQPAGVAMGQAAVDAMTIAHAVADSFAEASRRHDVDALARLYAPGDVRFYDNGDADRAEIKSEIAGLHGTIAWTNRFDVDVEHANFAADSTIRSNWTIDYDHVEKDGDTLSGTTANTVMLARVGDRWLITGQTQEWVRPSTSSVASGERITGGSTPKKKSKSRTGSVQEIQAVPAAQPPQSAPVSPPPAVTVPEVSIQIGPVEVRTRRVPDNGSGDGGEVKKEKKKEPGEGESKKNEEVKSPAGPVDFGIPRSTKRREAGDNDSGDDGDD